MKFLKLIMALGLGALVSACGSADLASRNAPFETIPVSDIPVADNPASKGTTTAPQSNFAAAGVTTLPTPGQILSQIDVVGINVLVPQSLRVSEANRYYPSGDIVWRGDPIGNRHAQVKTIFDNAFEAGTAQMQGPVPVVLDVRVERFHALTEKARYTVGGVHSIRFSLMIRDAETGAALGAPRVVQADLGAFGGRQAILAESRGQTQKVRISAHLAEVIRQELSRPEGYQNARLGLFQQINKL